MHNRKLQCISLLRIVHTDIILFIELVFPRPLVQNNLFVGTGFPCPLVQNNLFVGTGFPRPLVQNIANGTYKESSKSMIYRIYSNTMSKWMDKKLHIQTIQNQWIKEKSKRHKIHHHFIIFTNSCNLKKVALNPV